jgi:hypothetical protein
MGASSSIMPLNNNVYISFSSENEQIKMMYTELEKRQCNILKWNTKNNNNTSFEYNYTEYENDIKNSHYVIICISPDTIRSIKQIKEINSLKTFNGYISIPNKASVILIIEKLDIILI